jgi:hypothetical protein
MKTANTLRTLAVACAFVVTANASASPTLLVDSNGILVGVKNLDVSGTLYDVAIGDGSCNSLFNGCSSGAFAFQTVGTARSASDALFNSLLTAEFYNMPSRTSGCTSTIDCFIAIPYEVSTGSGGFQATAACIFAPGIGNGSGGCGVSARADFDSSESSLSGNRVTFGRFQLAAPTDIPEPSSLALFGLAMGGLAFNRRRKV